MKPGRYNVTAEATVFSKAVASDIRVNVTARQRVDLSLQVGQVTESIQVTGAAATVDTDSSEKGQVINTQQVVELALNGRNYADLALLSTGDPLPGATYAANSQIPINQVNPFAAAALNALPEPNGSGRSNNYVALLLVRDYSDKYDNGQHRRGLRYHPLHLSRAPDTVRSN